MNVIEEYLVRLGFAPDEPSFHRFQSVLADAERAATAHSSGIVKRMIEAQGAIVGAFTAASAAIIGTVDKIAMADQSYRLLGLRMLMTTESARKMDIITKALGADLPTIVWDRELHQRAVTMAEDIDRMTAALGPDFEKRMHEIRDMRFEFSRLEVAMKFLGMSFVSDLWTKLFPGQSMDKIREWVDHFERKIPEIADKLATYAVPVLKDTWQVLMGIGEVLKAGSVAFTNLVGLLSGDDTLESSTFSFERLAQAIGKVEHFVVKMAKAMADAESIVAHFTASLSALLAGKPGTAAEEAGEGASHMNVGSSIALGLGGIWAAKKAIGIARWFGLGAGATGAAGTAAGAGAGAAGGGVAAGGAAGGAGLGGIAAAIAGAAATMGIARWMGTGIGSWIVGSLGIKPQERKPGEQQVGIEWVPQWLRTMAGVGPDVPRGTSPPPVAGITAAPSTPPAGREELVNRMADAIAAVEQGAKANALSIRNNNPGNLRSWGNTPISEGYAKFATWEEGMAALRQQIRLNIARGLTVTEFFAGKPGVYGGFAPAGDGRNDPIAYAERVARALAIRPEQRLDQAEPGATPAAATATPARELAVRTSSQAREPHWYDMLPRWMRESPAWYEIAPVWLRQNATSVPTAPGSTTQATHYAARDWTPVMAQVSRPVAAPAAQISNQSRTLNVDVGGIFITQPGADEHTIRKAVTSGIQGAMDKRTQWDIAQLSPAW